MKHYFRSARVSSINSSNNDSFIFATVANGEIRVFVLNLR